MRLTETLTIGGQVYPIISREVRLELSAPGRATFRVRADAEPAGLVTYQCGYVRHQTHDFFAGYIEQATQEGKSWSIVCRELMNALALPSPVSLRRCLATDVLRDVTRATKVRFVGMDSQTVPRFASHADGFAALRNLPAVFGIDDFVFWQQTDGRVWCGAWPDSEYTTARAINPRFFTRHTPASAVLPALPVLRPGMLVNGRRVAAIRLTDQHETHITWSK